MVYVAVVAAIVALVVAARTWRVARENLRAALDVERARVDALQKALQSAAHTPFVSEQEIAPVAAEKRHLALVTAEARRYVPRTSCVNCRNWDMEDGQIELLKEPSFAVAAKHLTPNDMMQERDADGVLVPNPNALPPKLNRWDMFGQCARSKQVIHASENCSSFTDIDSQRSVG